MRAAAIDRGFQLLGVAIVLLLWTFAAVSVGGGVLPGPADVIGPLGSIVPTGEFLGPLWETLSRTAMGFALSFVVGVSAGIAIAKVPWVSATTPVLVDALLFAPTLVVIFLGLVMLGTNTLALTLITALVVGPTITVFIRDVMRDIDNEVITMADSYKVGTVQRVREVFLPYLIPPMLAAARIGFSMSWKVVLLGEVFLGWLIVFVVTLLLIEQLIVMLEKRIVRWQP
jgi:ABC-type nitrate/sulfonate/bicarbonate transport system permease component